MGDVCHFGERECGKKRQGTVRVGAPVAGQEQPFRANRKLSTSRSAPPSPWGFRIVHYTLSSEVSAAVGVRAQNSLELDEWNSSSVVTGSAVVRPVSGLSPQQRNRSRNTSYTTNAMCIAALIRTVSVYQLWYVIECVENLASFKDWPSNSLSVTQIRNRPLSARTVHPGFAQRKTFNSRHFRSTDAPGSS